MNDIFETTARQIESFGREQATQNKKWHIVVSKGENCDLHMVVQNPETEIPFLESIICIHLSDTDRHKEEKRKFLEAGLKALNDGL